MFKKALQWVKRQAAKAPFRVRAKETEEKFMGRCMDHMLGMGKSQDHATAACLNMWKER